jgi:hypothetical protein
VRDRVHDCDSSAWLGGSREPGLSANVCGSSGKGARFRSTTPFVAVGAAGVGFEPTNEHSPVAGFQDDGGVCGDCGPVRRLVLAVAGVGDWRATVARVLGVLGVAEGGSRGGYQGAWKLALVRIRRALGVRLPAALPGLAGVRRPSVRAWARRGPMVDGA